MKRWISAYLLVFVSKNTLTILWSLRLAKTMKPSKETYSAPARSSLNAVNQWSLNLLVPNLSLSFSPRNETNRTSPSILTASRIIPQKPPSTSVSFWTNSSPGEHTLNKNAELPPKRFWNYDATPSWPGDRTDGYFRESSSVLLSRCFSTLYQFG